MKNLNRNYFYICVLLFAYGCGPHQLDADKYLQAANDTNGVLCVVKNTEAQRFTLFYRPPEFFAALAGLNPGSESYRGLTRQYDETYNFLITMMHLDSSFENSNGHDLPENLLENIDNSAKLIIKKDTLACSGVIDAGMYGNAAATNFLMVFPKIIKSNMNDLRNGKLFIKEFGLSTGLVSIKLKRLRPEKIQYIGDKK